MVNKKFADAWETYRPRSLGNFIRPCICVRADGGIILSLKQQYYLDLPTAGPRIPGNSVMCLCERWNNTNFQNLIVASCKYTQFHTMQSSLSVGDSQWCWHYSRHSSMRHHLNKQMARYQAIFIPSETVQETAQVFFFFVSSERQQGLETQTEETIVHRAVRGHDAVRLPPRMAFHNTSTACVLEAGRILKLFSQSWQKNTGKWVDPGFLTKSSAGSARVPCFHTELHCCDGWTLLSCGFSRLISVYGIVLQLFVLAL